MLPCGTPQSSLALFELCLFYRYRLFFVNQTIKQQFRYNVIAIFLYFCIKDVVMMASEAIDKS